MRLFPAVSLVFGVVSLVEESWTYAHHGRFSGFNVALGFPSLLWSFISLLAFIGVRHRPTRLLAGFKVADSALSLILAYVLAYLPHEPYTMPAWISIFGFVIGSLYTIFSLYVLTLPLTAEERAEKGLD